MTEHTPRTAEMAMADIHFAATMARAHKPRGPVGITGSSPEPVVSTAGDTDASALRGALDGTTPEVGLLSQPASGVGPEGGTR